MTYANQTHTVSTPASGLAKLWRALRDTVRASSEASVKIAYDKPWLRKSGYQG
ncbi:MAG: hypothetical protein Q7T61_18310 [Caulobacter sp.]|nr:hypothetical protein [Caulobacter sp.]